jgi:hypothetical protein
LKKDEKNKSRESRDMERERGGCATTTGVPGFVGLKKHAPPSGKEGWAWATYMSGIALLPSCSYGEIISYGRNTRIHK